jgi:DNA-binding response OmpR family regulator
MAKPPTVLVVDDEPHIARLIEVNLVRAGYRVLKARSAAEAFEAAIRETPELILLDADMPAADGGEVSEQLRRDLRTRSIPLVMLTPKGTAPDILRVRFPGISSVLVKPFSPGKLLALVRRTLDARSPREVRGRPAGEPPRLRDRPLLSQRLLAAVRRILRAWRRRGR